MRNSLLRLFSLYKARVDRKPLSTQMLTAGIMCTLGDVISQKVIERKEKYDFQRSAIMGSCGFFYFGPVCGTWLSILNKLKLPVVACVSLDQLLVCPPLLSGFLVIQSLCWGNSFKTAQQRVKFELLPILQMNWVFWVPAQMVNFYAVPFQFRLLFMQFVALFWNSYLSFKSNETSGDCQ